VTYLVEPTLVDVPACCETALGPSWSLEVGSARTDLVEMEV
jgi:hypothetical protein